jgi:hypothetical protein
MTKILKIKNILLLSTILLYGCANNVWYKSAAQEGEFERTRYMCLQQSQQYQSGIGMVIPNTFSGGFTTVDTSGVKTNDMLMSACMQANGWSLENKRNFDSTNKSAACVTSSRGDPSSYNQCMGYGDQQKSTTEKPNPLQIKGGFAPGYPNGRSPLECQSKQKDPEQFNLCLRGF